MVVAVAVLLCLALAACGVKERALPPSCTAGGRGIERALAAAPGAVRLPDGTALSTCVRESDTDAELQNAGFVLTAAADSRAGRATRGDAVAALRLGYLAGAVLLVPAPPASTAAQLQPPAE